jgi:hypothetical protein
MALSATMPPHVKRGVLERFWQWLREHQSDVSKVLFLAAGLYGVVSVSLYPPQWGAPVEMTKLAANLVTTGSFANPFLVLNTGPTAANPPLYPFLLSILIRLLHSNSLVYIAAVIGCVLANAITAVLLPRASWVFYGDVIPGVFASFLWIIAMPMMPSWDVSYTILGLLAFCLLTSASLTTDGRLIGKTVLGGAVAALVLLLNPATLLIMFPWALFIAWRGRERASVRLKVFCIVTGFMAISLGGWGLRNYFELGGFTIRTNLGMTLYASNNDCAQVSMFRNQLNGCHGLHHPNESLEEAQLLQTMGEIRYDRKRILDTERWAETHPSRFLTLTFGRIVAFWFPLVESVPTRTDREDYGKVRGWITYRNRNAWLFRAVSILSLPGLILMACKKIPITIYIVTVLTIYPLVYYVVVSDMRYRFPILWLSLLPAGYFIYSMGALLAGRRRGTRESALQAAPGN